MHPIQTPAFYIPRDGNPIVGGFAARLRQRMAAGVSETLDANDWQTIEQMLTYAAEAEQRIAEQARRIQYLEALSNTDELTRLLNRRGFDNALRLTISNAKRHNETGLLGLFDLDGFKQLNDQFGHEAGDDILRAVGEALLENTRETDYVARIGGDEFAVLLVRSDLKLGLKRLQRLKEVLNTTQISFRGHDLAVRASLGVAAYDKNSHVGDTLRHADLAMYKNKQARAEAA